MHPYIAIHLAPEEVALRAGGGVGILAGVGVEVGQR